jgi:nucleoside-diphosphate-sugar epimerase
VSTPPPIDGRPLTESHPLGRHSNAYGRTKAAGDALAAAAGAVVLRPRAVYGPGDPHLLPRLRRAVRGGLAPLPGPDVSMSLTAVEDLAHARLAALDWPAGAYNIADADPYPRDETVHAVLAALVLRARPVRPDLARPAFAHGDQVRRGPARAWRRPRHQPGDGAGLAAHPETVGLSGYGPGLMFPLCGDLPMATLLLHVHREVIHHGVEILLLRDLYRARA